MVELTAAAGVHLQGAFELDRIMTPLPRDWAEHEAVSPLYFIIMRLMDQGDSHLGDCDERMSDWLTARPSDPCAASIDHRTDL